MNCDLPIYSKKEDAFQRYPFANRVGSVITNHSGSDSFVVGIYGKWGEGKTSVLNFIKDEVKKENKTIVIDFNPWLFTNEDQILMLFFNVLASGIDCSLKKNKEKIGDLLLDYASVFGPLGSLAGLVGSEEVLKTIGAKLSNTSIEEYKNRVNLFLEKTGKRVVVVMDDIDRLSILEVQIIFRLIKLVANFKNTIYLLSFDDELVASALDSTYSKGGYDYLEKIIQLPLRLPKAQYSAVRKYSLNSIFYELEVNEVLLDDHDQHRFITTFDEHILRLIATPRVVVRFTNSISFSIPLLKGEVNMVDLLLIEGLKVIFPGLYEFVKSNPSIFVTNYRSYNTTGTNELQRKELAKNKVEKCLEAYPQEIRELIKNLLKAIFPQLGLIFGNLSFSDDTRHEWYEKKRICSGRYFERYFSYVVIEGEISDVVFDGILDQIRRIDFFDKREELIQFFLGLDKAEVALKIQFLEDSFTPNQKRIIALNLCLIGEIFPIRDSGGFSIMAPFQQITYFIQKCVADQESQKRVELGMMLIDRAKPLNFSFEIWRTLHPKSDGGSRPDVLSETEFQEVSRTLYIKCRSELSLDELYDSVEDSYFRYFLGIGSKEDPEGIKYEIKEWLKTHGDNFLKLLFSFSQTTNSYSGGKNGLKTYKSSFSQVFYNLLKDVIDINFFYSMSCELYGDQSHFEPISDSDELTNEQLVGWFQRVHLAEKLTIEARAIK